MGRVKEHFWCFLVQREFETRVRRLCAKIYLQALEDFDQPEDSNVFWVDRWAVNATRLWNAIDSMCADPEPFWAIMRQQLPEAFADRNDSNSMMFSYHTD